MALLTFCCVLWFFGSWQHTFMHHADTNADGEVSQESCNNAAVSSEALVESVRLVCPLLNWYSCLCVLRCQDPDLYHYMFALRDTPEEQWNWMHRLQASK